MKILGISAHYHDAAAALVIDGLPLFAVQEERLSRRKNDAAFPTNAIAWCLERARLEPADLDAVVFYERSMLKFDRILTCALRAFPQAWRSFPHAMKNTLGEKVWIRGIISSHLGVPRQKIFFTDHHAAHAAAAFLTAPTRRAAILTADGVGEWATLTAGRAERRSDGTTDITLTREIRFPHSLGMLYSTFTAYLGFKVNEDEYKVMGLAAYGRPTMVEQVRKTIRRLPDGAFALAPEFFEFQTTADRSYSSKFLDLFGPARQPYDPIDLESSEGRRFADCAASVQCVLEEVLVDIAARLRRETGLADLCFGGGVALNGVANARILAEAGFDRVFVPPAPGDAGCALGAALYADRVYFHNPDRDVPDHPFWGPRVDAAHLARTAHEDGQPVEERDDPALFEHVADTLAAGRIVAWMDGECEFGPRALGHRSILAAPHTVEMRDRLNRDIKRREEFRPFAPVVPAEAAERFFDLPPGGARLARYMSGVFPVRPEWRPRLAAVTHVDGSARVQVLEREMAPRLHALLNAYGRRTGVPVLLNTSLNVAGEPIVTHALEGYTTFRRCGIDLLVAGSTVVSKNRAAVSLKESGTWASSTAAASTAG
ncbi:MAG TPA: carbamoyltransferase N-terminal domain-containing protein [Vicinamibacterales bacterium]|nr:carbamoyltransferase N-terminal domain-containing protein [Vicinamibacterales bacterium]